MPDTAPPAVGSNPNETTSAAFASAVVCQATSFVGICAAQLGRGANTHIARYEIAETQAGRLAWREATSSPPERIEAG
jgi:hypothetical protein